MMDRAEIRETLDKADELVTELKAFRNLSPESGNVTQFTVNAGGVGVWICVTSCIVMLLLSMFLLFAYLDVRDEQRVTAAHQATLYMLLPEVRKLVEQEMNKDPKKKEGE